MSISAPTSEPPTAAPGIDPERALNPAASLLDFVLENESSSTNPVSPSVSENSLDGFLTEPVASKALAIWFDRVPESRRPQGRQAVARALGVDIARIDGLLNEQVNAILHHPRFQKLESSLRGLRYLVGQAGGEDAVKFKVLNVTWGELARDAERAVEFDQSQLFRKVYTEEFGSAGGEPFGILIGDYEIRHRQSADHPTDDVAVLASISQVAAAAFAPFVAGADSNLFGLEDFTPLERGLNLERIFDQTEYLKWRAFRDTEDSRFVGLTMPRVLMRVPYEDDGSRADGFRFFEHVGGRDASKFLWGNAAWAFGAVVVRAFGECGWLADIRGVHRGEMGRGLVHDLPNPSFKTERPGVARRGSTDIIITDSIERELGELGFIALSQCKDTEFAVFYGNQSLQKPKTYDRAGPTTNARMSAMLQYMLCTSRFAHYLKVLARDKVGSFAEPRELEDLLTRWLMKYSTPDEHASQEVKAEFPLREGQVEVRELPGKPGSFGCIMHLLPHFQLDGLSASVRLTTELGPSRSR